MKVTLSYSYKDENDRNQGSSESKPVVEDDKVAFCIQEFLFKALQYKDFKNFTMTIKVGDFSGR